MASPSHPILPPIDSPPPIHIPALAFDPAKHPPRPPRPAHTNVLARLQALFPSSPHLQPTSPHPSDPSPIPPPLPPKPPPKFIKVRILTWNMHDSLPKGDVQELLGSVSPCLPSPSPPDRLPTLPVFPPSSHHPYHFVIVAGQECPSASGIPMALGAGFKLNNKDNSRSRHSLLPVDPDESVHRKSTDADLLSPPPDKSHEHHHPPSSWSSMLENWYSHPALGPLPGTPPSDPNLTTTQHDPQRGIGPYDLLIKERMMGLYLAVFIHRDALPFVRGTSKSAVSTGLIGGRVGNKGGVGVSVNLGGTTLLFINAHLAAHESRVHQRKADLAKIKAELSVDDFLSPDDPRFMAEDVTDRFDTTFIFGDLNFRLDITRLHADWLISRKEYEQALEFDQLRNIMATDSSFAGFNEAQIRFPPTFKYDVLRTMKRSRHRSFKRAPATANVFATAHEKLLSEVVEHHQEHSHTSEDQEELMERQEQLEENGDDEVEPDSVSVASSAWTSVRSRHTVDPDPLDDDADAEHEAVSAGYVANSPPASASASNLVHKMWSAAAAHKAKEKWVSLFNSPKSPSPASKKTKWRQSWASSKPQTTVRRGCQPTGEELSPQTHVDPADPRQPKAGRTMEFQSVLLDAVNARPHKHLALSENNIDLEEEDKGVYDSSHKQRVPSWCDRILWKSTIASEPEPDTDDTESQRFMPLRAKMGQIFNALRPSSLRSRRDSTWSMNHPDLSQEPTPVLEQTPHVVMQPAPEKRRDAAPIASPLGLKPHPLRRLPQTRSVDSFRKTSSEQRALARVQSLDPSAPGGRVPMRHANTISDPVTPTGASDSSPASPTLVSSPDDPSGLLDVTGAASSSPSTAVPVFRWLLPFLYRDSAQQRVPHSPETLATATPQQPPPSRRGDVVCLGYDTLDDRGMRRLEGRSDHRPVIGSYALYI